MRTRAKIALLIALSLTALRVSAASAVIGEGPVGRLIEVDATTGVEIGALPGGGGGYDMLVHENAFYIAGNGMIRYDRDGSITEWADLEGAWDVAIHEDGTMVGMVRGYLVPFGPSRLAAFAPDGAEIWTDTTEDVGYLLMGMDIPRSGPLRDGIVAIAVQAFAPQYFVFHWTRMPDGTLERSGPFGPIDLLEFPTCSYLPGWCARHLTVLSDGQSFVIPEGATNTIKQFDLDGSNPRVLVTTTPDAAAIAATSGPRVDAPTNVAILPGGLLAITTHKHVYFCNEDGTDLRRAAPVTNWAEAVTSAQPIPFEELPSRCRPWPTGFWKRQCASVGQHSTPGRARRVLRGLDVASPPIHPAMGSVALPELVARADRWLQPYGLTACEALQPDAPSTWREKALRRYSAVALNFEGRWQGRRCEVRLDGVDTTAGAVLDESRTLLTSTNDDDLKQAFHELGVLLREE